MAEKIFITICFIWFIYGILLPGMIFGSVGRWLGMSVFTGKFTFLQKPVYACPACMSPWWGTWLYWTFWGDSWHEWIVVIMCTTGANILFVSLMPND